MAIGHVRYSTTGGSHMRNVQPYLIETFFGPLGLGHNGNLTNALDLRRTLLQRGVGLSSTTDSEVIIQALAAPADVWEKHENDTQSIPLTVVNGRGQYGGLATAATLAQPDLHLGNYSTPAPADNSWESRIKTFMQVAQGAYSLVLLTKEGIYAVRDPLGLRPLSIGELSDGYVVASESCAILTVGAKRLREVEPGEIVRLDKNGVTTIAKISTEKRALCIFEYVYFARPDSMFEGQIVHNARQRLGEQLAHEAPAEADFVMGVPDSAIPAAIGYSRITGIPFNEGLTKNRYIGRTFIQPTDEMRKERVRLKYNPLPSNLKGKRVVLIDDSIVRGNTIGPIISLLREAGALEVHVRVSSPPVRHPCFMGIDMATYNQLIGHRLDSEEIRRKVGADSLAYLTLDGMEKAIRAGVQKGPTGHCTACFSGQYPLNVPDWLFAEDRSKYEFEEMWG